MGWSLCIQVCVARNLVKLSVAMFHLLDRIRAAIDRVESLRPADGNSSDDDDSEFATAVGDLRRLLDEFMALTRGAYGCPYY